MVNYSDLDRQVKHRVKKLSHQVIRHDIDQFRHEFNLDQNLESDADIPYVTQDQIRNAISDGQVNTSNPYQERHQELLRNAFSEGINSNNLGNARTYSHQFADIMSINHRNRGQDDIDPNDYVNLKQQVKKAAANTANYSNSIRALSHQFNELSQGFSDSGHGFRQDPNISGKEMRALHAYHHIIGNTLEYSVSRRLATRIPSKKAASGYAYRYTPQNANAVNNAIDSVNQQELNGEEMHPKRPGTPSYPDLSNYKENSISSIDHQHNFDLLAYQRDMARNEGINLTPAQLFAARHDINNQKVGKHDKARFNGYVTQDEATAEGNKYQQKDNELPHLHERAIGALNMFKSVSGFGASSKALHTLKYRGNQVTNSQGTGFADPYLRNLKEKQADLQYSRARIKDAIKSLSNHNVIRSSDVHYSHNRTQTINGNKDNIRSALGRVRAVANDSSNSNQQAAKEYLDFHNEAESKISPSIRALRHLADVTNQVTDAMHKMFGYTDNNGVQHDGNITVDPAKGRKPGYTYKRLNPGTIPGMIQHFLAGHEGLTAVAAVATDAVHRIYQADQQGNSVRMQEQPNIDTQMIGRAINGGTPQSHLDNHIQDWLGAQGEHLGYTGSQMSQFLANLGPTRATSANTMHAANTEAQFSRLNGVGPEATGQLFSTLANAGGLGTGNQVDRNSLDMSRQFAGMLHDNHLGGDATQQAQGLNSIFSNMISSGQTISPRTAGNVMAMQSVLSHGRGGNVFQGQQGAEQLNSFSHGVAGAFNNNLIRNAFASGMPQYGGQQGLYRLQMDMQEPLKHPTQLNNMVQGLSNIMGPSGAEDALTQMGLSPEGARKVYRESMNGNLTKDNLSRIRRHNQRTGRHTQRNSSKQIAESGDQTVAQLRAIKSLLSQHVSESGDFYRHFTNTIGGAASHHGLTSMLYSGFATPFAIGSGFSGAYSFLSHPSTSLHNMSHVGHNIGRLFRPKTWKAFSRGVRNGHGVAGSLKNGIHSVHAIYGGTHSTTGNLSRISRLHPIRHRMINFKRFHPRINRVLHGEHMPARTIAKGGAKTIGRYFTAAGSHGLGRVARIGGRALGPLGDAYTAYSDLKGMHRGNRARKILGAAGDVGGGIAGGAALGTAFGGPVGTVVGGAVGAIGGGILGKHIGSGIGRLFEHGSSHTAHAATIHRSSRSRSTKRTTYYWLTRINHLLPALAKKMEGFSDVDPSLSGSNSSSGSSETSGSNSKKAGINNDVTNNTGAKTINKTGGAEPTNAYAYHAQITPAYTQAAYGNVSNNDDHSHHQDSHNTYNNYVTAPSQNFLSELAQNAENAAQYYGQSRRTDWA